MNEAVTHEADRTELEKLIGHDFRELTSESDWVSRLFAEQNNLSANEFRALLFVIIAESKGERLTAGDLRKKMGLSGAAITYLVERMTEIGHLRREADPRDRRKVILRYAHPGMGVARNFFLQVAEHNRRALADVPDEDLQAAHRTFAAMVSAMQDLRSTLAEPDPPNA